VRSVLQNLQEQEPRIRPPDTGKAQLSFMGNRNLDSFPSLRIMFAVDSIMRRGWFRARVCVCVSSELCFYTHALALDWGGK